MLHVTDDLQLMSWGRTKQYLKKKNKQTVNLKIKAAMRSVYSSWFMKSSKGEKFVIFVYLLIPDKCQSDHLTVLSII